MNILIVDDEKNICFTLSDILKDEGHHVIHSFSAKRGIKKLEDNEIDLLFLDMKLPDANGLDLIKSLKSEFRLLEIVMISGHGDISMAVDAIQHGAFDFIEKPLSMSRVLTTIKHIEEKSGLLNASNALKDEKQSGNNMIAESPKMKEIQQIIHNVSQSNTKVLIRGESGTGKELVAWSIHENSPRHQQPFIAFNSAAIPKDLVESELFGYEKGAFTGANAQKKGKIELAHCGTLFLDEIGDMSLQTQAKLLRFIQEGEFERVGGNKTIKVDVRILAATHKNLEEMIQNNEFREDLFYRLNVLPIHLPPLRERKADIHLLINHFLKHFASELKMEPKTIDDEGLSLLLNHPFRGNIRELKNLMERLYILSPTNDISAQLIEQNIKNASSSQKSLKDIDFSLSFKSAKILFEKEYLIKQLEKHNWNISETADAIGLKQPNLSRKIKELQLK